MTADAVIRFPLGGNRGTLEDLLWNLHRRATVAGPMTVEIDDVRLDVVLGRIIDRAAAARKKLGAHPLAGDVIDAEIVDMKEITA